MTIYEVLERLIIGPAFKSEEEQAAVQVIRDLRDMNALGTTAASVDLVTHQCKPGSGMFGFPTTTCGTCGKDMTS